MTTVQPNTGGAGGYNPNSAGMLQMNPLLSAALGAATMAPGIPGWAASGLQAGLRGYNLLQGANTASRIGAEGPGVLGVLGGLTGLNNRADFSGNATIAAPGQWTNPANGEQPAVTQQGLYDNSPFGFLARLLGAFGLGNGYFDPTGAKTIGEAMHANAAAGFNPTRNMSLIRGNVGNDRPGGVGAAYGMQPGAVGTFGPAVVAGGSPGTGPNPLASAVAKSQEVNQAANLAKVAANNGSAGGNGGNQGGINGNINPGVGAGTMNANTGMLGHI